MGIFEWIVDLLTEIFDTIMGFFDGIFGGLVN